MTFAQICCSITDVVNQHVCIAQLDRALGYGPRCRGFESSCARDRSCLNYFRQLFVSSKLLYNSQILFIKSQGVIVIYFTYHPLTFRIHMGCGYKLYLHKVLLPAPQIFFHLLRRIQSQPYNSHHDHIPKHFL